MKIYKITYLMGLATLLLMTGCTKEEVVVNESQKGIIDDPTGTPVLFSVGNLNQTSTTRADVIPYMAQDGRFVCTMYYHSASTATAQNEGDFDIKHPNDHGTLSNAWLMVNNNVGNSVYRKNTFDTPSEDDLDTYKFDKNATIFYWQNRLTHAFLALADYNKLTTNTGDLTASTPGTLKLYPNYDKDFVTLPVNPTEEQQEAYYNTLLDNRYANTYDLTRGTKTSMSEQPDPILALTIMKPAGATQEANRVRLYFKHQFSQIQVNVKGADDNSANLTSDQIEKVELLGISETAYVYCRLNANGTVGTLQKESTTYTTAVYEAVNKDSYTDEQIAANKWGTSFEMFDMAPGDLVDENNDQIDDRYKYGFLKSFNAIAYGYLWAIRITWHEGTTTDPGVVHTSTYEVPQNTGESSGKIPLRQLQSGMKYIYDLELRRGTLAVIRTQIVDWKQDTELVYGTSGTISE